MADIKLRVQFPAAPDLSVGDTIADEDVQLRVQFPAAPDLSVFPTQWVSSADHAVPGPLTVYTPITVSAGTLLGLGETLVALTGQQITSTPGTLTRFLATDTFTGSNNTVITSHAADSGQSWIQVYHDAIVGLPWIQSNRLVQRTGEGRTIVALNDTSSSSHNQTVKAAFRVIGNTIVNGTFHNAIGLRLDSTVADYTGYWFYINANANEIGIFSATVGGGNSPLVFDTWSSYSSGNTYVFELRVSGDTNPHLEAYIDGVLVLSYDDIGPDPDLLIAGKAGLALDNATDVPFAQVDTFWWSVADDTGGTGNVNLTGQSSASAQGSLKPALDTPLTGQVSTASFGVFSFPRLTGQQSTSAQGTLIPAIAVTLTGQVTTAAQGSLTVAEAIPLTGQVTTVAQGTLKPAIAVTLTGQAATFGQGTFDFSNVNVTPTGQSTTTAQGSLKPALAIPLTGQATSSVQGTAVPTISRGLLGAQVGTNQGLVGVSFLLGFTGFSVSVVYGEFKTAFVLAVTGSSVFVSFGNILPISGAAVDDSIRAEDMFIGADFDDPLFSRVGGAGETELLVEASTDHELFSKSGDTSESALVSTSNEEETMVFSEG